MGRCRALTFLGWPLLVVPQIIFYFGAGLNQLACVANGGAMPVLWNSMNKWSPDPEHVIMTSATHLKILCDWIGLKEAGVWSPGDILLAGADSIIGPCFWLWMAFILYRAFQSELSNL